MCAYGDLVETVSATAVMCEIGAGPKHNVSDDDHQCMLIAIMNIGHADVDYTYRDTQPDNADTIGRIENKWSSDTHPFAHKGPRRVLLNKRDVTDQSHFDNITTISFYSLLRSLILYFDTPI